MSATAPALLAASAGVGFGHAILPDHWVPLAVVGRTRHYPLLEIARRSSLAGLAHVLLSIVLGAVIIAVGLQFRSDVQKAQEAASAATSAVSMAAGVLVDLLFADIALPPEELDLPVT